MEVTALIRMSWGPGQMRESFLKTCWALPSGRIQYLYREIRSRDRAWNFLGAACFLRTNYTDNNNHE